MKRSSDKYELDEYPDACDFLAKEVFDVPLQQPVGFVWRPRIRVKAISVPHDPNSED